MDVFKGLRRNSDSKKGSDIKGADQSGLTNGDGQPGHQPGQTGQPGGKQKNKAAKQGTLYKF